MLLLLPSSPAATSIPPTYKYVAARYHIPAEILYAVALVESGKPVASLSIRRPWPWTLNIAGQGTYFPTRRAAWQALDASLSAGETRIDIGLMQVNWRFHQGRLKDPWLALQPDHNLNVAAEILRRCYAERRDWWASVDCYHAPNHAARARRYTERVRAAWRSVAVRQQ
jgi:hypothetical protein